MRLTQKDIYELLDSEISWCKENELEAFPEFRRGFIAGLEQARLILREAYEKPEEARGKVDALPNWGENDDDWDVLEITGLGSDL